MKYTIHFSLSLLLALTPVGQLAFADAPASGGGGGQCNADQIIKECSDQKDGADKASTDATNDIAATKPTGVNGPAQAMGSALGTTSANTGIASGNCAKILSTCSSIKCGTDTSKTSSEIKRCQDTIKKQSDQLKAQSDDAGGAAAAQQASANNTSSQQGSNDSGAGMGQALSALAPLALVAAMIAMKPQPQPQPAATPQNTGALQPNGSVNCAASDGYNYSDCDSYNQQACASAPTYAAPTAATAGTLPIAYAAPTTAIPTVGPNCAGFINRYCSTQQTAPQAYADTLASGQVVQVNIGGYGAGLGSQFCTTSQATSYCTNPSYASSRAQCPSCQQLSSTQSAICQSNPSLCLASPSTNQLAQARSTCPDDPIFANPANSFVGSAAVIPQIGATGGAPATVLPQSVTPGHAARATASVGSSSDASQILLSQTQGTASAGTHNGMTYVAASVGAGGSTVSSSGRSEVAAGIHTASAVDRAPANDVASALGPSLFTTSTNIIRQRCLAGKLNNCP